MMYNVVPNTCHLLHLESHMNSRQAESLGHSVPRAIAAVMLLFPT